MLSMDLVMTGLPGGSGRIPLAVFFLARGTGGLVHRLATDRQAALEVPADAAVGHRLGVERGEVARLVGLRVRPADPLPGGRSVERALGGFLFVLGLGVLLEHVVAEEA